MSVCQRCKSNRVLNVSGKCSDMCYINLCEQENDGYVPNDMNIGGGDYLKIILCLDCGQVQGTWPLRKSKFELELERLETEAAKNDPFKKGDFVEFEFRGKLFVGEIESYNKQLNCVTVLEHGTWDKSRNKFIEHTWSEKGQCCNVYIEDPTLKKTDKEW